MLAWIPLLAGLGCGGPDLPRPIELAYDGQRVQVDGKDLIAWPDCGHAGCGGDVRAALEARRSARPADDPLLSVVRVRVAPEVPYSALAGLLEASLAADFDRIRLDAGQPGMVAWPLSPDVGYVGSAWNDGWLRTRGLTAAIVAGDGKVTAAIARDGHPVGDVAGACVGPAVPAGGTGAWGPHLEATLREHAGTEPVLVTIGDDVPAGDLAALLGPLSGAARELQLSITSDELDLHCDTTVVGKADLPRPPPSTALWTVGSRPGAVDAYVADCAAVLPATTRTAGDLFAAVLPEDKTIEGSDECVHSEFAQNCEPDPYGCWNDYQECRQGCGETCSSCQSECAATCGTCKEACRGDRACVRACATERASCRDGCMSSRGACRDSACLTAYVECPSVRRAERFAKCDRCERAAERTAEAWRAGETDLAKIGAAHREIEGFCWELCRGAAQDRYQLPP